jgi:uncharacterized protein
MLSIARDLVRLEEGARLILMNGRFPRPLVFSRGIDEVKAALASPEQISDTALCDLLVRFRILVEGPETSVSPASHQAFNPASKADLSVYLLVTQRCNLGCTYCLGKDTSYLDGHSMSSDVAERAIRRGLDAIAPGGVLQLIYFGGEPLLNWELMKHCFKFGRQQNGIRPDRQLRHHVTTNLTQLPSDFIETAKEHSLSVLVDIDGPCSMHNKMRPFRNGRPSYDRIIRNLDALSRAGIYFEVRATITAENVAEIPAIHEHHHRLKPQACAFPTLTPVDAAGRPLDPATYPDPAIYRRELNRVADEGLFDLSSICPTNVVAARMLRFEFVTYGCGMLLGNTAAVTHEGAVYPCIYLVGRSQFLLGHLQEETNPFAQPGYARLFEKWKDRLHVDKMEKCRECSIRYLCGGGCPLRIMALDEETDSHRLARDYFRDISCAASWAAVESTIRNYDVRAAQHARRSGSSPPPAGGRAHDTP